MENIEYTIEEFNRPTATDEELFKVMDYDFSRIREDDPDEPEHDREKFLLQYRDKHPHYGYKEWLVKTIVNDDEIVIGNGNIVWSKPEHPGYEKNKTTSEIIIVVRTEYQKMGIGTKLFSLAMKELLDNHPEVAYIIPESRKDYVWDLFENYGGKFSQEEAENRMYIEDVNWDMINDWIALGEKLQKDEGVTLQFFEECPEDILEEYVAIYHETMNQQPLGEWDGEFSITPETRRKEEQRYQEKGLEWYTLISREKDGSISGLTEMLRYTALTHKGLQLLTGVQQNYRGRGLGKWLKAEMLVRMREKFSEMKYITTWNDETNAAMLSINKRMGFRQFMPSKAYKFNLKELRDKFNELHPDDRI